MHTEEQAKKLWCPQVHIAEADHERWHVTNRQEPSGEGIFEVRPTCLASGCAAWRWLFSIADKEAGVRRGYCGLAGRPEGMAT